MYQKSLVLPPNLPHHQKMIFEMELRGYSQHTKDHYLGHLRLLEKHTNKSATQITPTNSETISMIEFNPELVTVVSRSLVVHLNSFSIKFLATTGQTTLLSVPKNPNHFRMFYLKTRFCPLLIRYRI